MTLRFRVLGPIQVERPDGSAVPLGSPKQHLLLAVLLCHVGEALTPERLMDHLWGSHPPPSADANLRSLIHQLRASLGAATIAHDRNLGYVLAIGREQIDATQFADRVEAGRALLAAGDAAHARRNLGEALALWRGEPFGRSGTETALQVEVARLNECYAQALEYRIEADLALGRHRDVVGELTGIVARFPLREAFHAQLMLALYRSGRQAEALEAYRTTRAAFIDDLGLTPGPELSALHEAILRADPALAAPRTVAFAAGPAGESPPKPALLPPDTRVFTGRADHLATLDAMLAEGHVGPIAISAIHGMGGVGKTALAVHWAYRVRPSFPDGQLYVNLRGYSSAEPMLPVDALRRMLFALGVAPADLPTDLDDAAGLYRSLLADRRAFILLDNARDSEQVRPLLPGGDACLVVITSRDRLGGLVAQHGARSLRLDVLAPEESVALLAAALRGQRCDLDGTAAQEMSDLCGHLPLALTIAAANLADSPQQTLPDYLARLRTGDRLGNLQVDGEPQTAVRHTFDLSYHALSKPARRLLCLLALVPGEDAGTAAAAALAGTPMAATGAHLEELTRRHLLQEDDGRFRLHDLVHAYAADRCTVDVPPADRAAAYDRLLAWYATAAAGADAVLRPTARTPAVDAPPAAECLPTFADQAAATGWFDLERDNLAAALARRAQSPDKVWRLALSMRGWLQRREARQTWVELYRHGIGAARLAAAPGRGPRDEAAPAGEATLLTGLAIAHSIMHQRDEAVQAYESAVAAFERIGDLAGRIDAVASLGGLLADVGQPEQGMAHLLGAYDAVATLPDQPDLRFKVEMNLGYAYRRSGQPREAMRYYEAAAATAEHSAERAWLLASVLSNIGTLHAVEGRYDEAGAAFTTMLSLARETGDRGREASALDGLAEMAEAHGRRAEAIAHLTTAVELMQHLGDHHLERMRRRLDELTSRPLEPATPAA